MISTILAAGVLHVPYLIFSNLRARMDWYIMSDANPQNQAWICQKLVGQQA